MSGAWKTWAGLLRPGDAWIGGLWLALLAVSLLFFAKPQGPPGQFARVITESEVRRVSLADDGAGEVLGPLGVTHYRVHNGRIQITQAPCPQKHCVHWGAIQRQGEVLVCVPNRVVIEIEGGGLRTSGLDAVTQ